MSKLTFTIHKKDTHSRARLGTIQTTHGAIETPVFMPVGTRGAVKGVTTEQLYDLDAHIVLNNTYHLMLKPGVNVINEAGGLHKMMRWDRPILTDSGGFQVFSLSDLRKITEKGVAFQSHIDGSRWFLGPEESMAVQRSIGSDIVMAFDECPPYPAEKKQVEEAVERTFRWAERCKKSELSPHQNLFGIVQGGGYEDLRRKSAEGLVGMDFEGYAIGGLSVGEPAELMYQMIEATEPFLPENKPRYLMGVGTPRNLVEAVMRGVDMFDCVMPTRNARNGTAFTSKGKIVIKAGKYANDHSPVDEDVDFYASKYSKAYLRHLLNVSEITGLTLVTLHNLAFYLQFMRQLRLAIKEDRLMDFYEGVCEVYPV